MSFGDKLSLGMKHLFCMSINILPISLTSNASLFWISWIVISIWWMVLDNFLLDAVRFDTSLFNSSTSFVSSPSAIREFKTKITVFSQTIKQHYLCIVLNNANDVEYWDNVNIIYNFTNERMTFQLIMCGFTISIGYQDPQKLYCTHWEVVLLKNTLK